MKELQRVKLDRDTDLLHILEDVHMDKAPRLIERAGEPLAVVIDPEDYPGASVEPTSRRLKKDLLALAGVWSDVDTDRMIEKIYQARDTAPPSPAPKL